MKMRLLRFLALYVVSTIVGAEGDGPEVDEGVYVLTEKNFDGFVKENSKVLVEFYAPWCGHCKALAPEYAKAATVLAEKKIEAKLAKVDATVESSLGSKFGVSGYPTLKWFVDGSANDYDGPRSEPGISNWVTSRTKDAFENISSKDVEAKAREGEFVVVAKVKSGSKKDEKYKKAAGAMRSDADFTFYRVGLKKGKFKLTLYRNKFQEDADGAREIAFTGKKVNVARVTSFLKDNSKYLISKKVTGQEAAKGAKGGAAILCVEDKEKADLSSFTETAKKYKDEGFKFVVQNESSSKDDGCTKADQFVLVKERPEKTPGKGALKYKAADDAEFTGEAAATFIEAVKAGTVERFVKSEDVPEKDAFKEGEGAGVLVGSKFEETVYDQDSDTLVEFYAPWCGHCKKYAPKYDKLARYVKKYYYDKGHKVQIYKANAIDNDFDADVSGFPTIILYPGGKQAKNKKFSKYDGDRDQDDLIDFISENAYVLNEGKQEL